MSEQTMIKNRTRSFYVFCIAFTAAIGGFLFGFDLAIMAGANIFLRDQFHLSDAMFGFTTVSAVLGCIIGPFSGGWMCDRIGRERTLLFASLLLAAGAIITAVCTDIITLNIFRFVGGVGVGLCSLASPMYIAEVAPARMRGSLGVMYQLAIVVGSVVAAAAAYWLAKLLPPTLSWRWMFASEMIAVVIFAVFVIFLPRSPRWLAERGRFDEALEVLKRVDGLEHAQREIGEIKKSLHEESATFAEVFQPHMRKALTIGLLLALFNNWTGWSGMSGYLPFLFQKAGVSDRAEAILQFVFAYGVMGVLTAVACWLVDRLGRRPLWIFSSMLMVIATALIGLVFQFDMRGVIVLLIVSLCAVPHALALGPLPWLMMSEIYPTRLRAKAVTVTTTFLWVTIFTIGYIFPVISGYSERTFGSVAGVFWVFTVVSIGALFFGLKWLPETKGRTLEAIAESFRHDS